MCNDHWKSVRQYKTKFTYLNKPREKKRERERERERPHPKYRN